MEDGNLVICGLLFKNVSLYPESYEVYSPFGRKLGKCKLCNGSLTISGTKDRVFYRKNIDDSSNCFNSQIERVKVLNEAVRSFINE